MSLLERSLTGAAMILAIVVLRALCLHRLPKRTFPVLWGVALARLLVPFEVPSALSVYSLLGRLAAGAGEGSPAPSAAPGTALFVPSGGVTGAAGAAVPAAAPAGGGAVDPWTAVWLAGAVVCGLFFAVTYCRCRRVFHASLPVESRWAARWLEAHPLRRPVVVRQSDRISAPLTYGLLRPVILMPKTTDWTDEEALGYVLAHEHVHIRRFDGLGKLVLAFALCVHWFDPMVWVMYVLANRDMELACDEAVLRAFGAEARGAYAMTLIRMEERRSGGAPLCSHFSKNPVEERIRAIMKLKKTSLAALVTAAALVVGVTTAFATSAQPPADPRPTAPAQTLLDRRTVLSYDGEDGETYYSTDNGKTWERVADKDRYANYDWSDVEWWTAEEYAAWLEQEKKNLQAIIGERGWNPTDGWYTWTQELVDEAIARYEETLEDIRAGKKVSKPTADGDTMIQYGYDPGEILSANDTILVFGSAEGLEPVTGDNVTAADKLTLTPALLADYEAHGLTYYEGEDAFYFKGKLVRWLFDGYEIGEGTATIYDHTSPEGEVDVYTVREAVQNADGSMDPGGKLLEIKAFSQEEFDNRILMTPQMAQTSVIGFVGGEGVTFEERFARYKDFGITYLEADGAVGRGNVYWNGQPVSLFADMSPDGGAFTFTSAQEGGLYVQTVYDEQGKLTGAEEMLPDAVAAEKEAQEYARDEAQRDYEQTKELLAPYFAFGLDCQMDPDTGSLTMTWQGVPVRRFFDARRGIFVANSLGGGGLGPDAIDLEATYGQTGALTALTPTAP